MTGYGRTTPEQWQREDLDRAEAAGDHAAISEARKAGALADLMSPPSADATDPERIAAALEPPVPVGPTVPGQQPGGGSTYDSGAPMTRHELDALSAAGAHDQIVAAHKAGRLRNLGA